MADGPNELKEGERISPLPICLGQFKSLIIWILVGAATTVTDGTLARIERALMARTLYEQHDFSELFVMRLLSRNIRYEVDLVDLASRRPTLGDGNRGFSKSETVNQSGFAGS